MDIQDLFRAEMHETCMRLMYWGEAVFIEHEFNGTEDEIAQKIANQLAGILAEHTTKIIEIYDNYLSEQVKSMVGEEK